MVDHASSPDVEVDRLRFMVSEALALRQSENVLVARGTERVSVILMEVLTEIAPFEFLGPWQKMELYEPNPE